MLEAELSPLLSPGLRALMFNKGADFKKHCQGADMIIEALPTLFGEVGDGAAGGEGLHRLHRIVCLKIRLANILFYFKSHWPSPS